MFAHKIPEIMRIAIFLNNVLFRFIYKRFIFFMYNTKGVKYV
jgi:hypothetical protein